MKKLGFISLILFSIITLTTLSYAEIPKLINYQGHLTDKGGNPLTGTFNITFTIYDAVSGGNNLWSEPQNSIKVKNGLFSVLLGSATIGGIPESVFDGVDRYLGVKVGSDSEMSPREQLVSVPYAYKAKPTGTEWQALTSGEETNLHTHSITTLLRTYDSGWFAVSRSTIYTRDHNLGTTKVLVEIYLSDTSDGSGIVLKSGAYIWYLGLNAHMIDLTTSQITISIPPDYLATYWPGYNQFLTSGYARIIMLALE